MICGAYVGPFQALGLVGLQLQGDHGIVAMLGTCWGHVGAYVGALFFAMALYMICGTHAHVVSFG